MEEAMSFDLRIRFVGLAMFVPEPAKKAPDGEVEQPARMHVLLPAGELDPPHHPPHDHHGAGNGGPVSGRGEHGGHPAPGNGATPGGTQQQGGRRHHERHFARVAYDTAYETENSADITRELKLVSLEKRTLDLVGLSGEGLDPSLPGEICQLSAVAGELPPGVVGTSPGPGLLGRVTMDAGVLSDVGLGAFFKFGPRGAERMTTRTEWTIRGIPGDRLPGLALRGLNGEPDDVLPELFPVRQTIHLVVFNAPRSEFPPNGEFHVNQPEKPADHFELYYNLYPTEPGDVPQSADVGEIDEKKLVRARPKDERAAFPDEPRNHPHAEVPAEAANHAEPAVATGGERPADGAPAPVGRVLTSATMTCVNAQGTLPKT
jgi:hypothetical protein